MGCADDLHALDHTKFPRYALKFSFDWFFNLNTAPKVYFSRWNLFDETMDLADKSRPFYEFGVWTGISFKYLIKILEKGFYFDTFYRLPQHWHNNKGTYSS